MPLYLTEDQAMLRETARVGAAAPTCAADSADSRGSTSATAAPAPTTATAPTRSTRGRLMRRTSRDEETTSD